MKKRHVVATLVVTEWGIPLVRNPKKPQPIFWKLPGGKGEGSETLTETATREIEEETGMKIPENLFELIEEQDRDTHIFFIFRASVSALELGIAFSDPIADGPILQAAAFETVGNVYAYRIALSGSKEVGFISEGMFTSKLI